MKVASRFFWMFFLTFCFSVLASQVEAREWTILGPRALGMGGAHVAVANDATASYWNPAAYGFFENKKEGYYSKRGWSTVLPLGVGVQIHEDLGEMLDDILDYDYYDTLDTGRISADRVADYIQLVNNIVALDDNENGAVMVSAHMAVAGQKGHFGVGVYTFGEVSGKGNLDLVNIGSVDSGTIFGLDDFTDPANYGYLGTPGTYTYYDQPGNPTALELRSYLTATLGWTDIQANNFIDATDYGLTEAVQAGETLPPDMLAQTENLADLGTSAAGTGGSFADNDSSLLFKGITVTEVPLTYGRAITKDLAVGGNVKFMEARVYNTAIPIFDDDFGDALKDAIDRYEKSRNFGIDLGLLYRFGDDLRVGLVGRNLNSPDFDMEPYLPGDDGTIEEKPQVRAGVAYQPVNFVTFALDVDLTKNETTVSDDFDSQNIGGGVEIDLFRILKLRGGAYKNLAEDDIGVVYTAGLGLNVWLLHLDIGASMASESTELDGDDIPKEAKVMLALSMLF